MIISPATLGLGAQIMGSFGYQEFKISIGYIYLIYNIYMWASIQTIFFTYALIHASKALGFKCLRFCPQCEKTI